MNELLSKAIRSALLEIISDSFEVKKKLSFSEQLGLYNAIAHLPDDKLEQLYEHLFSRRKKDSPPRISKVIALILKVGIAAVAGGAFIITLPIPGAGLAIFAATYYLFQVKNYECEIACRIREEKRPLGDKKLCYHSCEIKSWEAVKKNLKIERISCKGTPNPDKCYKRLDNIIKKIDYKIAVAKSRINYRRQDIRGK